MTNKGTSVFNHAANTPDNNGGNVAPQVVIAANTNTAPIINVPAVNVQAKPGISKDSALVSGAAAVYPNAARINHIQGTVVVEAQIDEKGNVTGVKGISGNPVLQQALKDAVMKYKYSPAIKDDKAVPSSKKVTANFAP